MYMWEAASHLCWLVSLHLTELEWNIANWTRSIEKGVEEICGSLNLE